MKVKVIRRFVNKYSKKTHEVADIIEVSATRFEEINSTRHGKLVEEIKEVKKEETKKAKK